MGILDLAGVDVVSSIKPAVQTQLTDASVKPYTAGLETINQANQRVAASLQYETQSVPGRAQDLQQGYQAQSAAVTAAGQASAAAASTKANNTGLSGLAGTIKAVGDVYVQIQKQAHANDAAKATQAVKDLKLKWTSELYKQGVAPYRQELLQTLAQYQLEPAQLEELTKDGYSLAQQYTESTVKEQQDQITKTRLQLGEVTKNQFLLKLNGDLAQIANDPYAPTEEPLKRIDQRVSDFLNQSGVSDLDKATTLAAAYQAVLNSSEKNSTAYAQINQRLEAVKKYANLEAGINEQLRQGAISPGDAQVRKQQLRLELGVHPEWKDVSPNASEEYLRDSLGLTNDLDKMRQDRMITESQQVEMGNDVVSYWAWQFAKSPDLIVAIQNDKKLYANPGMQRAVELAKMYKTGGDEVKSLTLKKQSLITELAQVEKQDITWFINQARNGQNANVNAALAQLRVGLPPGNTELTPEQKSQALAAFSQYKQALADQIQVVNTQIGQAGDLLQQYGLYGSPADIETRMKSKKANFDAWQGEWKKRLEQSTQVNVLQGNKPPFDLGADSSKAFATMKYGQQTVRMPFPAGVSAPISGDYGEDRGDHAHAGYDFAVPAVTPILSVVRGKVARVEFQINDSGRGYGQMVDVIGDDGKLYRYAHMTKSSPVVQIGQVVQPGQLLGKSGDTGAPGSFHLHFEVRDPKIPYGFQGTLNPLQYLGSAVTSKNYGTPMPRQNANLSGVKLPDGAFPLSNGTYIHNGKIYKIPPGQVISQQVQNTYTSASPLRDSYLPSNIPTGSMAPDANHGYAKLAQNVSYAKALNSAAKQLGIPGQWLADLMAFETGGTFSPNIDNGLGYVGLIQCGEECRADAGVSYNQLARMSFEEQMSRIVVPYMKRAWAAAGTKPKGIEWVQAAVWGGASLLKDLDKRGAAAVNDPKWNDGYTTFREYLDNLGSHAGRKYDHIGRRKQQLTSTVHDKYVSGCAMCNALKAAGTFIVHDGGGR